MAAVGMDFSQNLQKKGLEAAQKGVPEAKWALDGYKSAAKMIFMVCGPPLELHLWSHLRS